MEFWYHVAERLIAHVICITPLFLWFSIASLVSWYKDKNVINLLHKFIAWYLRRICGGAAHCYNYGYDGLYLVVMSDAQYHRYAILARDLSEEEFAKVVWALRDVGIRVA